MPEGVHREATGPAVMCGVAGEGALDLLAKARASSELRPVAIDTPRFILFADASHSRQLIFTNPTEAAYPAATCRHVYEADGALHTSRQMRCDAGREECDALFLEFQALDAEMTRALRGGN